MAEEYDTYYAYSNFATKINEWGRVEKSIQPGEVIEQKDLKGVTDEEWANLIEVGAVSPVPYPEDLQDGESPSEAFVRQDAALRDDKLDDDEADAVRERQAIQANLAINFHRRATALASADKVEDSTELIEEEAQAQGLLDENRASERDYEAMDGPALKTLAAKREIEGRSNMDKEQLVEAHKNWDAAQPKPDEVP